MDISKIIQEIPTLFIYFIPGYVSLYIKENYLHEKTKKDTHLILLSIILSFVIKSSIDFILYIIEKFTKSYVYIDPDVKSFIYIVVAILVGIFMILYKDSKLENRINQKLKNNVISEPTVWNHAMKCSNGGYARVYLHDEDLIYVGDLINYTLDPEESKREILLAAFTMYKLSNNELIEDNAGNENATVLIECKDMKNIEIFKCQ